MILLAMLKKTLFDWFGDRAPSFAAAIAFYAIFSFIPLAILAIWVLALLHGQADVQEITGRLTAYLGDRPAAALAQVLYSANLDRSPWTVPTGLIVLVIAATAMFAQVQAALNAIWKVPPKGPAIRQVLGFLRHRLLAFIMVVATGVVFLISVALEAAWGWLTTVLPAMPAEQFNMLRLYRLVLSFLLMWLMLAMIFKVLPDARIRWRDVLIGALLTAGLLVLGQVLIGMYLGHARIASAYGAAGSLVLLLIWVYYSALVFLLGAEFTHVYASTFNRSAPPVPAGSASA